MRSRIPNAVVALRIADSKLDEVSRRLKDTRIAIGAIPDLCGVNNANALKNLFKKRYGVSMRDYRSGTRG